MSNSFKECESINNSSVPEQPVHSLIKKVKVKRKVLNFQTFHQIWKSQIPRWAVIFRKFTAPGYIGAGNPEWLLWPKRKQKNPRSLFFNFAGDSARPNNMEDKTFLGPFLRLPLTSVKSLVELKIDLTDCKRITDKTILLISSRLKHIQSLEYLEVCLQENEDMTNSGIQQIASFAKNFRSLKGFYFGRSQTASTKVQGINMITLVGINIRNNIHGGFKLDDKSLILISPAISVMKSLTNLTLNLLDTKTTDAGVIPLFKALTHLDRLQYFTLILCISKIGDLGLVQLAKVLSNLHSLQGLVIDFGMCQHISESGITSLMSSIQKMEKLTALFLSFFCCYKVDDKTVNEMALALTNMKGLNCLVLDLGGCHIKNGQAVLEEAAGHIVNKRIRTGRVW